MNIDELVRGARPEPGWARSAGGQRVLDGVITTARADSGRTGWDRRVARRPALRWSLMGTGLVGAAAAVALVAPALVSTPEGPQGPPAGALPGALPGATGSTGGTTTVTARDILLAAATRAERVPAATGRYWHVKTLNLFGPVPVGTEPDRYSLLRRTVEESWDARAAKDPSWHGRREAGARPRAEADEKAWRAAGSPAKWTLDSDGSKVVLSTRPGAGELSEEDQPPRYLEDLGKLSLDQVRRLPADPRALRAWVTSRIQQRMGFAPGSDDGNRLLYGFLGRMLLDTPAEPGVRAAAFRILADIPGVRGLGAVRDESGRPGQGVEFTDGVQTVRLIVDTATHLLLAERVSANPEQAATPAKEFSTLVLAAEWSDAAPRVPSLPQ